MNMRAEFFGGEDWRQGRLLPRKKPKQTDNVALTNVVIAREETRRTDMRQEDRPLLGDVPATIIFREGTHDVAIVNLSGGGAMISFPIEPYIGERLDLHLDDEQVIQCVVRWVKGGRVGLEFAHETHLKCTPEKSETLLRNVVAQLAGGSDFETLPVLPPPAEARKADRHPLIWSGELSYRSHKWDVRLRNISETGALVQFPGAVREGSEVVLGLGEGVEITAVVSRVVGDHVGLEFNEPFDLCELSNCKPQVTPPTWIRPAYLEADVPEDSAWDEPWNRMSLRELQGELEGFLKR